MDDPRTADGVEHLQRAARELLAAARSFLDVAEEMVEDPDRFTGAASQVADLLRGGLGAVMPDGDSSSRLQPWETAAWSADAEPDGPPEESADRATVDQLFGVGDARQELVLIGIGMDESKLRQRLDACLLTDAEMAQGPHAWTRYDDPFPAWS